MGEVSALIEGGKATAGAPLGPALGPLGVNIGEVVAKINEKTKSYSGMKVPVTVEVESNGSYDIIVGSPPTSALIIKELGAKKGGANQKTDAIGNLSMAQVKKLAELKIEALISTNIYSAAREIVGTCNSMAVTVEGKRAKEIQAEFKEGKWDSFFGKGSSNKTVETTKEQVKEIVEDVKEKIEEVKEDLKVDEVVEKVEKVIDVVSEKVEEAVEEIKEVVFEKPIEAKKEEPIVEEKKEEAVVEKPKEEIKKEPIVEAKKEETVVEDKKEETVVEEKKQEPIVEAKKEETIVEESKEDAMAEALEEEIKEAPVEVPKEASPNEDASVKKESYSQHMQKLESQVGAKSLINISEDKPKEKIETEVVKDDGNTEIIRPKKEEK